MNYCQKKPKEEKKVANYNKKKQISAKTYQKLKKKFTNNLNGYNFAFA